jgi:hypothetical protein
MTSNVTGNFPNQLLSGPTETFATDVPKNTQWPAFLKKTHAHQPKTLDDTIGVIVHFSEPVIASWWQESENRVNWTVMDGWQ